ncbi:MAG: hypothetical protein IJ796_03065 [Lachnospiraceae bacterium]|nr:hypothetical protein [Lachnospiraceae bacterium]
MNTDADRKKPEAEAIMDAIGNIDEDLLMEADRFRTGQKPAEYTHGSSGKGRGLHAPGKAGRLRYIALPIAAAAVLFIGVIIFVKGGPLSLKMGGASMDTASQTAPAEYAMAEDPSFAEETSGAAAEKEAESYEEEFNGYPIAESAETTEATDAALNMEAAEGEALETGESKLPEITLPDEWKASGCITSVPVSAELYRNIEFDDSGAPMGNPEITDNHTSSEFIKSAGCEELGEGWYYILTLQKHDLTGDYWVFLFVNRDSDVYYELSLSAECFSEEEAEEIAGSVRLK